MLLAIPTKASAHSHMCFDSTKRSQSLKEVQLVLNLPELNTVKHLDTRWLAHECCVQAVKPSYSAIVNMLDHIYCDSHESEALGIKHALCSKSTIVADFVKLCSSSSCRT